MENKRASVPEGFERRPEEKAAFARKELKQAVAQTVSFRPGRGPGRPGGPGAEVEKADNIKGTASRLLQYFSGAKKQLAGLIVSVIAVTLLALAAPAMQGAAIDSIQTHDWPLLYRCAGLLLGWQKFILMMLFLTPVIALPVSIAACYYLGSIYG